MLQKAIKMCSTTCRLCSVGDSHLQINLPNGKSVIVGRNRQTGIRSILVSREQVKLTANLQSRTVTVIPIGRNPSGANGFMLQNNKEYILKHKDKLEILLNNHVHEIIFDPVPNIEENSVNVDSASVKRKRNLNENEDGAKKIKKCDKQSVNQWEEIDDKKLLIFTAAGVMAKEKIAAYDLDGTIITTKSGARFPKNAEDWQFAFPEVPKKLREMHENDYKIVIFTNQAGIGLGKQKVGEFRQKVENIISKLNIPIQVFVSTGKGIYRKPAPGMWNALSKEKNNQLSIDLSESFYCGDAAGREKNWAPKKKKDHSIADRLFAINIGLTFKTPEEYFLGARKISHIMPEFDPRNIKTLPLCMPETCKITSDKQEVIVFVGSPGSGKSFICKNMLVPKGYIHINRDNLGSWQKCVSALEKSLQNKESVVIDNTNPDKESRKRYLAVTKKFGIPCRCFVMNTSIYHAKHNNTFREITDSSHQPVADIIINSYKNKFMEPKVEEGFDEVVKINCNPNFYDSEHKKLYHMFLLDK